MSNVYRPKVGTVIQKRRTYPLFVTRPLKAATLLCTSGLFYSIHNSKTTLARQSGRIRDYSEKNKFFENLFGLSDRDYFGFSAFHWACLKNDVESLRILLSSTKSNNLDELTSPPVRPNSIFLLFFHFYELFYLYYDNIQFGKNSQYPKVRAFFNLENQTITPGKSSLV